MEKVKEKIYVQLSAGRGPVECAWVVAKLLKVLLAELKAERYEAVVLARSTGFEAGTLNSCLLQVSGNGVRSLLKTWEGTIQWIGKSPFRKFHKRKNWFVGLSVFGENEHVNLHEKDLVFSTFRGSGPGGQHRNKVETAVRVVHKPTGLTVTSSDSKSQMQNRKSAIEKIKRAFKDHELEMMRQRMDEQWKEHLSVQRGNPSRVFEGAEFKEKRRKVI